MFQHPEPGMADRWWTNSDSYLSTINQQCQLNPNSTSFPMSKKDRCSSNVSAKEHLNTFKDILRLNGYPENSIERKTPTKSSTKPTVAIQNSHILRSLTSLNNSITGSLTFSEKKTSYYTLPTNPTLSEKPYPTPPRKWSANALETNYAYEEMQCTSSSVTTAINNVLVALHASSVIISFVKDPNLLDPLTVNSLPLESINTTKLLGVHLSSDHKWSTHVEAVCAASKRLFALRSLKCSGVSPRDLRLVYSYFIRPVLEYACPVWHTSLPRKLSDQLEQIQRRALRIIVPHLSYTNGLNELDLTTLEERRESLCKSFYKSNLNTASKLCSLLPDPVDHYYNLRNPRKLPVYKCRNNHFSKFFTILCLQMGCLSIALHA